MNKYRIQFELQFPEEKLEYYVTAKNDEVAKKYFLLQISEMVKNEGLNFDKIYISHDSTIVQVFHNKKIYIAGKLACVPNKFRIVSVDGFEPMGIDTIITSIEKYGEVSRSRCDGKVL